MLHVLGGNDGTNVVAIVVPVIIGAIVIAFFVVGAIWMYKKRRDNQRREE